MSKYEHEFVHMMDGVEKQLETIDNPPAPEDPPKLPAPRIARGLRSLQGKSSRPT